MSKRYRIRLINQRVVGPLELEQIGELFKSGHITGQEEIENFSTGEWEPIKKNSSLQEYFSRIIDDVDSKKEEANFDSTVARINRASLLAEEQDSENDKNTSSYTEVKEDGSLEEFKFNKDSNSEVVDYDALEKKYNEQEKKKRDEKERKKRNIEETILAKNPLKKSLQKDSIEKTVINSESLEYLRQLKEEKEKEDLKQRDDIQEEGEEENLKEEEVNFEDKTQFFDKNILVELKNEAKEVEEKILEEEETLNELNDEEEENLLEENKEEFEEVIKEKRKIRPIAAFAIVVLFWFLLNDDSDERGMFEPKYVNIEAPITFEVEDEAKAKELYKKGLEIYQGGTYLSKVTANSYFKKSVEYKFNNNPALGVLILTDGEIFENASNRSKAASVLFNLIKITESKTLTDLNIALGTALFYKNNKKLNSAINLIEKYLRVGSPSLKLLSVYLDLLIETGDLVKATDVMEKIKNYPNLPLEAYRSISKYYTLDESYKLGKETILNGLKEYPSSVALMLDFAEYLLRESEFEKYSDILKKIESLHYESSPKYYARYLEYVGILSAYNKDIKTAAFLFKTALKINNSDRLRSKLATLDVGGGRLATKLILESKAIDLIRRSKKLMKEKKWELAFIEAIAATELEIDYLPAKLHLINLQIKRGYYESAINTLEFLRAEYPTHPGVNFTLVKALAEANKIEEAQTQVNIISNSNLKNHPLYYSVVGDFYKKSGRNILAVKFLRRSVQINPLRDSDYFLIAEIYSQTRQYKECKSALSEAITLDPLSIEYRSLYAEILYELEGAETAIGYVQASLEENKDNPILMGDIATFYYRNGQVAQFKDIKGKIEKLSKTDPGFYKFLLKSAMMDDNTAKIIQYAKELIEINPGDVNTRIILSQYLLNNRDYKLAIHELKEVIERLSTYPKAYYLMGKVYLATKEYKKSLGFGKKEIENNPAIYNGYYIVGEANRLLGNIPQAVNGLEKAISIEPRNVESLISLGKIKMGQRNYDVARELFLRAKKQSPSNPMIRKELGFIYQGVGQSALAIEQFETYLKLWPNAPDRQKILGHIQVLSR